MLLPVAFLLLLWQLSLLTLPPSVQGADALSGLSTGRLQQFGISVATLLLSWSFLLATRHPGPDCLPLAAAGQPPIARRMHHSGSFAFPDVRLHV